MSVEAGGATVSELSLGDRVHEAIERATAGARAFVIGTRVVPVVVRGPAKAASADDDVRAVVPAELHLPDGTIEILGPVQSHVVLDGDHLQLWLSRLERLPSGSVVTVVAATASGDPTVAELAVTDRSSARLRFVLPWPEAAAPEVVLLVVRLNGQEPHRAA